MKSGLKGGISIDTDSGPHGIYFDAVVVEVKNYLLLFRLAPAILCYMILNWVQFVTSSTDANTNT